MKKKSHLNSSTDSTHVRNILEQDLKGKWRRNVSVTSILKWLYTCYGIAHMWEDSGRIYAFLSVMVSMLNFFVLVRCGIWSFDGRHRRTLLILFFWWQNIILIVLNLPTGNLSLLHFLEKSGTTFSKPSTLLSLKEPKW